MIQNNNEIKNILQQYFKKVTSKQIFPLYLLKWIVYLLRMEKRKVSIIITIVYYISYYRLYYIISFHKTDDIYLFI